ncbi:MAG: YggT family protein [Xanthomonadales bacterium]|nr:YggT family protein [Xanthomonadales bacterium]
MSGSPFQAISYLIGTLIDLYVAAILLRLLLQLVRADFYNPLSQFLIRVTNPVVVPFRRVVPSIGPVDTASIVAMYLLQASGIFLITAIGAATLTPAQIFIYAVI